MQVQLERPCADRMVEFLDAVNRSRELHRELVEPPATRAAFRRYLARANLRNQECFLLSLENGDLAGVINIAEILRGGLQSAFLGYYAFVPHAGRGYMRLGLQQVVDFAFRQLRLHRLEANIQPHNERSIGLVRSLGFRLEGRSPKYLKIAGRWRDHERWAILAEEWTQLR